MLQGLFIALILDFNNAIEIAKILITGECMVVINISFPMHVFDVYRFAIVSFFVHCREIWFRFKTDLGKNIMKYYYYYYPTFEYLSNKVMFCARPLVTYETFYQE